MISNRCDICLDSVCGGKRNCNCAACDKAETCYRDMRAVVRITLACTQSCRHCAFRCRPGLQTHMTPETAATVGRFLTANGVTTINVMGGEFFCNPRWDEVLAELLPGRERVRITSNGDWAGNPAVAARVVEFFQEYPQCYFALSHDKWHSNLHITAAEAALAAADIPFVRGDGEDDDDNAIVPVGRSQFEYGLYAMFACWCSQPRRRYLFLVDEAANIHKCPFGGLVYAEAAEYETGGFAERFQEVHGKFYKAFVGSCRSCQQMIARIDRDNGYSREVA